MVKPLARTVAILAAALGAASALACVHQTEPPPVAGPSTFAHSVTMTAIPDRLTQDGASQSSIQVLVIGPDGHPLSGIALRVDTVVALGGQLQFVDFGTLGARTVVTGNDGIARTVYTAPPPAPGPNTPVQTVSIRAVPISSDAQTEVGTIVDIRLVPVGVILPPAGTPTAQFTVTPTPVNVNIPATFDGSLSSPGQSALATRITSYVWNFGDGATGSGQMVTHTFTQSGTFNVTLTVTNDRGLSGSTTQAIAVGFTAAPTAAFVFSPTAPVVGQAVVFNADQSKPAPGRTLTQFNWIFGDGDTTQPVQGFVVSHKFAQTGTYNVTLAVLDDVGQKGTTSVSVPVGTGNPVPALTFSPSTPHPGNQVNFDATGTTTSGGATIIQYQWEFGDGNTSTTSTPTVAHAYGAVGTYIARVTVTDSLGRIGTVTATVTVS